MQHHFNIDHAKKYGVNEAILINNFAFWIVKNKANDRHIHDGRTWTYNSMKAMTLIFPYWTEKQIRRVVCNLVDANILMTSNFNENPHNRTLWYAFVDEEQFLDGQMDFPKRANGFSQKGKSKRPNGQISNGTDNKPDDSTPHNPPAGGNGSASPSAHQEFIRMWTESFAEVWGEKYLFAGGRDAKAVKSLLSGTDKSPQELVEIAKRAWNSPEKLSRFLFDQSKTLPCFASRFNEIITALKSKAHSNGHATIPPMTRLKIIKEQIEAHPANITSIKHDENCGEEKKQELRNLRAKRDQLEAEIANG